jgi:hypothetical protein
MVAPRSEMNIYDTPTKPSRLLGQPQTSRPGPSERARRRPTTTSSTTKGTDMTAVLDTPPRTETGMCPDPGKRAFDSKIEALAFVAEDDVRNGTDNTPYGTCNCGKWHNTTNTPSRRKPKSSSPRINGIAAGWPDAPLRPGTDLTVGFYILRPKTAAFWLHSFNIHNRSFRAAGAGALAIDIHVGGFDFNGDTFRFDTDGVLFDGQHRCAAIAEEGDPVPIILVTGLDPQAQDTTDTGMRRAFADALKLAGESDVNNLASVTAAVCRWKTGQIRGNGKTNLSVRVLQRVLRDNPDIRDAVRVARALRSHVAVQASVMGLASWLFRNIDQADHDHFFDRLASGADLAETSPILLLRKRLLADVGAKQRLRKPEILALVIKAWNHFRDGNEVTYLKWTSGGRNPEPMPKPR